MRWQFLLVMVFLIVGCTTTKQKAKVQFPDPNVNHAEEGKWTKKADMPTARCFLSTSIVNGNIYAIGGWFFHETWDCPIFLRVVEKYNPAMDKWTKKADMPTVRYGLSTSVVNGKIYAIGGGTPDTCYSTVEEYNPATDKWEKKSDMPTARATLSTSAVNGKIYAIGGGTRDTNYSTVEEYNPATDKWEKKSDMPTARAMLSTSVVNGKIYAIGGIMASDKVVSTVEEYNPATDIWTEKADMLTARCALSTSVVNGKIYAIGGAEDSLFLSTVEEYDTGLR